MKTIHVILTCLVMTLLAGCAFNKQVSGRPIDDAKVAKLVRGETTVEQVIELFGAPTSQSAVGGNILYTYTYSQTKGSAFTWGYGTTSSGTTTSDDLTLTFDQATGKLKVFSLQRGIGQKK
jgi:outer membrane protein assembly factor BamE (lipoprotein component of BamABCDE complex)